MHCLLHKKVQVSKTNIPNLNFSERLRGLHFKTSQQWNRRLTIWDGGNFFFFLVLGKKWLVLWGKPR